MKTAYVHIGTNKTGTSSIQDFLFKNREDLIKKGFLYPVSGTFPREYSHKNLATALGKLPMYNPNIGDWQELIDT